MLKLKILGSSSKGNCYLLSSDITSILLDCGVKHIENKIDVNSINGVVLTHKHGDHVQGLKTFKNYFNGKYYSHKEVLDILPVLDNQKVLVEHNKKFEIGSFIIVPFQLEHDVLCYGYLIKDTISNYKLLYVTDTGYINHKFKDIDCFLIESNCDEEILTYEDYKETRLYDTHLSMQQTASFLENNINHNTEKIILCHISRDEENYKKHEEYIKNKINNNNIEVIAINPHLDNSLEIILKEDLSQFNFE